MCKKEINVGDYVRLKNKDMEGIVSSIVDYGTHICYFIDMGGFFKFPARAEWIELCEK